MKKLAKVAQSFVFSMIVSFTVFSTAQGELNTYYWDGIAQYSFSLTVMIMTMLLYFLIEDEE